MGIAGRPTKARDRLRNNFMSALADDFTEFGAAAIVKAREDDPLGYVKVCASLMPKEVELSRPLDDLTDEQLEAAIIAARSIISAQEPSDMGDGEKATPVVQQAGVIPALPETV